MLSALNEVEDKIRGLEYGADDYLAKPFKTAELEAADIHGNKWINNVEKETAKLTALNNSLLALTRTGLIEKSQVDDSC